ncbi:MAG: hypothetical protein GY807_06545 [Gammaproteobacteria bacterium]|nr:hypothetical protein [Gammaproteobacteria bacterium]
MKKKSDSKTTVRYRDAGNGQFITNRKLIAAHRIRLSVNGFQNLVMETQNDERNRVRLGAEREIILDIRT